MGGRVAIPMLTKQVVIAQL